MTVSVLKGKIIPVSTAVDTPIIDDGDKITAVPRDDLLPAESSGEEIFRMMKPCF
jgi:hypothetical protein